MSLRRRQWAGLVAILTIATACSDDDGDNSGDGGLDGGDAADGGHVGDGGGPDATYGDLSGRNRLALGAEHGCVVQRDGSVVCWGVNTAGQATAPAIAASSVAAFGNTSAAIAAGSGAITAWGDDAGGAANGLAGMAFHSVSIGGGYVCGIARDSGAIQCAGSVAGMNVPAGRFRSVAAARDDACAVAEDGTLICFGADANNPNPLKGTYNQVVAGEAHFCALATDGRVGCWGLGNSPVVDAGASAFAQAVPPAGRFRYLAAGAYMSCGIRSTDGTLSCWGRNTEGEVSDVPAGAFLEVACGLANCCAVSEARALTCWGSNAGDRSTPPSVNL